MVLACDMVFSGSDVLRAFLPGGAGEGFTEPADHAFRVWVGVEVHLPTLRNGGKNNYFSTLVPFRTTKGPGVESGQP